MVSAADCGQAMGSDGKTFVAKHMVAKGEADGALAFTVDAADAFGNKAAAATSTSDGSSVTVDSTPPTLTEVSLAWLFLAW